MPRGAKKAKEIVEVTEQSVDQDTADEPATDVEEEVDELDTDQEQEIDRFEQETMTDDSLSYLNKFLDGAAPLATVRDVADQRLGCIFTRKTERSKLQMEAKTHLREQATEGIDTKFDPMASVN
jgi:hypothetical protein